MKKRFLFLGIWVITLGVLLTGCVKFENNVNKENTTEAQNQKENTLTDAEMYDSILEQYKDAMAEYNVEDIDIDDNFKVKYNMVSDTLLFHVIHYQNNGVELRYAYYDIDKNGVNELIMGNGTKGNNDFYAGAIYAYNKDAKKPEKVYYQSTLERGSLNIYDNGIINSEGSGGAALHYYSFGKIAENGYSYESIEEIEEEYVQENKSPIYRDYNKNVELSYKGLDEIKNKYLNNSKAIEFTENFKI